MQLCTLIFQARHFPRMSHDPCMARIVVVVFIIRLVGWCTCMHAGLQCYTGLSVANGRIAFTNGARYPSSVFYMCDTGFLLSDTSKAVGLCVVDSAGQNADWRFTSQTYDPQNSTTVDPPTCVGGCDYVCMHAWDAWRGCWRVRLRVHASMGCMEALFR